MRDVTINISDRLDELLRKRARKYCLDISELAKDLLRLSYGLEPVNDVMKRYEADFARRD